jgi:alpha-galactosidase
VHDRGLKFGIHIMRGIHRAAVYYNTPIKGTSYTAGQIGEPWDTCDWCNHMFGVDPTQPGAQEYYNSLFELYAEWGVDYIKADDVLRPVYHRGETELIRNAIEHCGRPMVLSLSPGEAPLSDARHLSKNAHMWRISADLWDEWEDIEHNFELLEEWSSWTGPGNWPDADMIPVGRISLDGRPHGPERMTMLTWNEQGTLMSLWCMARSPLMIGADLVTLPDSTLELLSNDEVLYVNQRSIQNRQVLRLDWRKVRHGDRKYYAVWTAEDPENGDRFVGLFNLLDEESEVCFDLEWEMLRGKYLARDLWQKKDIGTVEGKLCTPLGAHGAAIYRLSKP